MLPMEEKQIIREKQNIDKFLEIQYSAGVLYRMAEILSLCAWILAIAEVVIAFIEPILLISTDIVTIINAIIILAVTLLQCGVEWCAKYGAGLKMYFDCHMFDWQRDKYHGLTEKMLKSAVEEILHLFKKDSAIRMQNTGEEKPRGVKNWYESVTDTDSKMEAIRKCQDENMWWTKEIAKKQKQFFGILCGVAIVVFVIVFWDKSLGEIVLKILMGISLCINLGFEIARAKKQEKIFVEYNYQKERISSLSMEEIKLSDLESMQVLIDKRRKIPILTISKIHDLYSNRFHAKYEKINT